MTFSSIHRPSENLDLVSVVRKVECRGMLGVEISAIDLGTLRISCLSRPFFPPGVVKAFPGRCKKVAC